MKKISPEVTSSIFRKTRQIRDMVIKALEDDLIVIHVIGGDHAWTTLSVYEGDEVNEICIDIEQAGEDD